MSLGSISHRMRNHMRTTSQLSAIVLAGALSVLAGCAIPHSASTTWEYRVVRGTPESPDLEDRLNKAGADGFAIASSQTLPADQHTKPITIVILKRIRK